jgi:hypothetical protein
MPRAAALTTWQPALRPGERLRLLAELETPAGTVAEMAYAPGWCEGRHRHREASLIYIVGGDHWATHSRGGDTARAGTVRYLPADEPHETYFPLGSTCLQLELQPATLELAARQAPALECPGELRDARAAALGARLHRELFTGDDLSQLDVEGVALQLLLTRERPQRPCRRGAPDWVLQVGEMLREEIHTRFALQAIAQSVGRHPVQVSRQFHEHFGLHDERVCAPGARGTRPKPAAPRQPRNHRDRTRLRLCRSESLHESLQSGDRRAARTLPFCVPDLRGARCHWHDEAQLSTTDSPQDSRTTANAVRPAVGDIPPPR